MFRHREFQRVFLTPCRSASVCFERPARRWAFHLCPVWNPRLLGVPSHPTLKSAPYAAYGRPSAAALVWRGFQGMLAGNARHIRPRACPFTVGISQQQNAYCYRLPIKTAEAYSRFRSTRSCSAGVPNSLQTVLDYFQRFAIPCSETQPAHAAALAARMPKICSHIGCS